MKALKGMLLANWREFSRDRTALFFTFAFPIIFIVIFGLVFRDPGKFDQKVGIALEDQGQIGAQIASSLENLPKGSGEGNKDNPFEKMTFERGSNDDLQARFKDGKIQAIVVIPAGLTDSVSKGQPANVQVYVDQTSQVFAPFMQGVVSDIVAGVDRNITQRPSLLGTEVKSVLSSQLRGIDFLIPGILAMTLMNLGLFATAQPLIALRVQGILKRLGATPLPRSIVMLAYISLRVIIAVLQTAIIVGLGMAMFQVSVIGNWLSFVGWVLLGALMFVAIGFFVAAISKTEESGAAITNLLNFPMLFLSGVFFEVNNLPSFLSPIVKAMPLTYTVDAIRQSMIGAPPVNSQMTNFLVQFAWLVVMTILSVRFFKWDAR
ncbi:MAG: ABC transporter permease [Herpetosiphon sp.]|nr:ABC transporter permease [Herpetosiphon sp.]